jgi:hypothetical protein
MAPVGELRRGDSWLAMCCSISNVPPLLRYAVMPLALHLAHAPASNRPAVLVTIKPMPQFPPGQTLLIDADDTLWENNIYFERAIAAFIDYLNHHASSPAEVRHIDGRE